MNYDYAEQRLMSIGYPLDAAFSLCQSMRKDGTLEAFVAKQEQEYREMIHSEVGTMLGL